MPAGEHETQSWSQVTRWRVDLRAPVVLLGLDPAQRLVGRQLEFGHLTFREGTNSGTESRLGDGPHLKRERNRLLGQRPGDDRDHRGPGELGPVEVGREWNDDNRPKNPRQRLALPDDDWPASCLLACSIGPRGPPDFATRHLALIDGIGPYNALRLVSEIGYDTRR